MRRRLNARIDVDAMEFKRSTTLSALTLLKGNGAVADVAVVDVDADVVVGGGVDVAVDVATTAEADERLAPPSKVETGAWAATAAAVSVSAPDSGCDSAVAEARLVARRSMYAV